MADKERVREMIGGHFRFLILVTCYLLLSPSSEGTTAELVFFGGFRFGWRSEAGFDFGVGASGSGFWGHDGAPEEGLFEVWEFIESGQRFVGDLCRVKVEGGEIGE